MGTGISTFVTIPLQGFMPFGLSGLKPTDFVVTSDNPSAGIHAFRTLRLVGHEIQ